MMVVDHGDHLGSHSVDRGQSELLVGLIEHVHNASLGASSRSYTVGFRDRPRLPEGFPGLPTGKRVLRKCRWDLAKLTQPVGSVPHGGKAASRWMTPKDRV